ncbi:MAG: hypothetical protein AAF490_04845 [Chloroflexota bacterium]
MLIDLEPLLFLGWLAVIGGLLNTVGDWRMLGFPIAGKEFALEMIKDKPLNHVVFGVYIAMGAIPLWFGIIFATLYLLRNSPVWVQATVSVSTLLFIMFSFVYHIAHIFYDIGCRNDDAPNIERTLAEMKRMRTFLMPISLIMALGLIVGGILGGAPIWWIVFNPFVITILILLISRAAPAPIGGYLLPGGFSLGWTLFCLVTMLAV